MPALFERSADTDAIIDVLRGVNDRITYQELARRSKVGSERLKSVLPTARRALMKDNVLFDVERGVGLVRLNDSAKVKLPPRRMKRIHNQARNGQKELRTIEQPDKLSRAEQLTLTTVKTIFHMIRQHTANPRKQRDLP